MAVRVRFDTPTPVSVPNVAASINPSRIVGGTSDARSLGGSFAEALGPGAAALGAGLGQRAGFALTRGARAEKLNPVREAALKQLTQLQAQGQTLTPSQMLLLQAAQEPKEFARIFENPDTLQQAAIVDSLTKTEKLPATRILVSGNTPLGQSLGLRGNQQAQADVSIDPQGNITNASIAGQPINTKNRVLGKVIGADSAENELFDLGFKGKERGRVEFEVDEEGNVISALPRSVSVGAPTININQQIEREQQKAFVQDLAASRKELRESAQLIRQRKPILARLRQELDRGAFRSGALGETRLFLSQLGDLIGVDLQLGEAASGENLRAIESQLAQSLAENFSRVTNLSLTLARDAVPKLSSTPKGVAIILDAMQREVDNVEQEERITQEFLAKNRGFIAPDGTSLEQVRQKFRDENPIFDSALRERAEKVISSAPTLAESGARLRGELKIRAAGEVNRMSNEEIVRFITNADQTDIDALSPESRKLLKDRIDSIKRERGLQ